MVLTLIQFKHRLAALEMMAFDQTGGFELGQHPVNRRQSYLFTAIDQGSVDGFSGQMSATILLLKHVEDLHARQGHFQTCLLYTSRCV